MTITPLYAALLGLLFVLLSVRTVRSRRQSKVALGDGGNVQLQRIARVHANFAEYAPLALLLILLVELQHSPAWLVHALGLALLIGRCSHAYGVSQMQENFRFRVLGMVLTLSTLLVCSAVLLVRMGLQLG